ncbi:hypothetical protein ACN42_g7398 [Penicillium freii]|uniref:Uncharacterized protein n=1 Tax=Penicillium freii TaxID=48697 RepID=A0A124GR07_PENFR|nr:hypothetical protein ACN42_g7398 [Penicillium freii]
MAVVAIDRGRTKRTPTRLFKADHRRGKKKREKKKERTPLFFNTHSISSESFFLVMMLEMASEDTPPDFVNRMEKVPAPYLSEQYGYSKDGKLNIIWDSPKDKMLTDIGRTVLRNDCMDAGP